MNPMMVVWWEAMCRASFGMLTGTPHIPRKPIKEPPTFPRSDMVEAMEEERDGVSSIRSRSEEHTSELQSR